MLSWGMVGELIERYGLPLIALCAVVWAWYRERRANTELNAEVLVNSCETTAALVSVKSVVDNFRESLTAIDTRFNNQNKHLDGLVSNAHKETRDHLEVIEKKIIELTVKLDRGN